MIQEPATLSAGALGCVLIVDDHPLYSDALAASLIAEYPSCDVRAARSMKEALKAFEDGFVPDLVMFDLKLPDVKGISGFEALRERVPDLPVLVISSLTSAEIVHALMERGAAGFLPKDACSDVLRRVVSDILNGQTYVPAAYANQPSRERRVEESSTGTKLDELTPQQQKIIRLICSGKANKQIAYELCLAEATVKAHITALLRRLGVQNRTQAAMLMESSLAGANSQIRDPDALAFLTH